MYAQFDDIIFEPINSFGSFDDSERASWAIYAPLEGNSSLQPTGTNPRELNISIRLHQEFTSIKETVGKLRTILRTQKVCGLHWGNGDVEGSFVLEGMDRAFEEQDDKGNVYMLVLNLHLLEYDSASAVSRQEQVRRMSAPAVGTNSIPVQQARSNAPTERKKAVNYLAALRRYQNRINSYVVDPEQALYNYNITKYTNYYTQSLAALKSISGTLSTATDRDPGFDTAVDDTGDKLTALKAFIPVTSLNVDDFKTALANLNAASAHMHLHAAPFVRKSITRRNNAIIAPFI